MRDKFPGYYRPTAAQFETLWRDGIFAFDTNILLHVYRFTQPTCEALFEVLAHLGDRIWLPNQAALEFQRDRMKVTTTQRTAYEQIGKIITGAVNSLEGQLGQYSRHPAVDIRQIVAQHRRLAKRTEKELAKACDQHPDLLGDDPLRDRLDALFDGKVGDPYDDARM